jgi:hypothetical protein
MTACAKRIGVICFVGQQLSDTGDQADARFGHHTVSRVTRREHQHPRTAPLVDNSVDFAVPAAFGNTYGLRFRPPFPPLAQR